MATQKYIAGSGAGFSWTAIFSTEVNSLANNTYVTASTAAITNQTALDLMADVSISLGSITPTGNPYVAIYVLPLSADASTYPNGTPPPITYEVGRIGLITSAGVQTGVLRGIILPPNTFKFGLFNGSGVTFNAGSNTIKYITYNFSFA